MTRKLPSPALVLVVALLSLFAAPASGLAKAAPKKAAPAKKNSKAAAPSRASKGREKSSRREVAQKKSAKPSKKEARAERGRKGRQEREVMAARGRGAKNDRRSRREERRESARVLSRKELKRLSPRERRAYAAAEARRRREAAEAARRAAIARALYLARIRAQDQAYRDETQANIARDETTGEDLEVRRAAVEALGNTAGTVVVMDPKTGRVYTVVNQDWALRRGFKPCSTVKLVTGLAGLTDSVIDPVQTVNVSTASLSIDLTDSLAYSNNGYFQTVGGKVGFDRMMFYARKLGLGQPTGINHPNESPGRLPFFKEGYAVNHMSSHGDDIEITPIQLANLASTIANGGDLLVPHLPRTPQESVKFERQVRAKVDIPQEQLRRMIPGMIGAVNYGTARRAYDPTQTIAGKTGTCIDQRDRSWLGLFTSYAPVYDPKLAVAVVTHGSGARGKYAAEIAGKIYRALGSRFGGARSTPAMLADETLNPHPKIDPSKAAALDDEDAEVEAEETKAAEEGEAYVVKEAGDAGVAGPQTNVKRTSKVYEKPAAPAVAVPQLKSAPAPQPSAPASAPAQGESRPRRVNP
jgi:membrane peptidoglycan carboxypeptidase